MATVGSPTEQDKPEAIEPQVVEPPAPGVLREGRKREPVEAREAVKRLAEDRKVEPSEAASATQWFLDDTDTDDEESTDVIEINVGSKRTPKWITWGIQSVEIEQLRRLQKMAANPKIKDFDELEANIRTVVQGTTEPDLREIASQQGVDQSALVRKKFNEKPGLLAQIASKIMDLSGFDTDDVREADAAGN